MIAPEQYSILTMGLKLGTASCALLLSACTTGKSINATTDMIDDGKYNTMLVSYNVTVNTTDKHPKVEHTELIVNCGEPSRLGNVPECFRFTVPFKGRKRIDEYEYYSFAHSGSVVLQMPYGAFDLHSVQHHVVVDVENYSQCGRDRFGNYLATRYPNVQRTRVIRRFNCLPVKVDVTAKYFSELPEKDTLKINAGNACYAGHMKLELTGGEISHYRLDKTSEAHSTNAIGSLSDDFQKALLERKIEPCADT